MKLRALALGAAALSLSAAPVVAEASLDRTTAPVEGENLEGTTGIIVIVLGAAALIAAIILIADDDDDEPVSP